MCSIRSCNDCIQLTGSQDAAPRVLLPQAPPPSSSSEQYFCLNLATIVQNFDYLFWHNSNFYYGLPNYLANFYFPGGCLLAVGEQNGTLVNSWMAVKLTLEPDYFDEAGNRQQPGAGAGAGAVSGEAEGRWLRFVLVCSLTDLCHLEMMTSVTRDHRHFVSEAGQSGHEFICN